MVFAPHEAWVTDLVLRRAAGPDGPASIARGGAADASVRLYGTPIRWRIGTDVDKRQTVRRAPTGDEGRVDSTMILHRPADTAAAPKRCASVWG